MSSSCILAIPSLSSSQNAESSRLGTKRTCTSSDLHLPADNTLVDLGVPSASPSLPDRINSTSLSCSSSWSSVFKSHHRCDMALRVMLKKHECQFKLPQGILQMLFSLSMCVCLCLIAQHYHALSDCFFSNALSTVYLFCYNSDRFSVHFFLVSCTPSKNASFWLTSFKIVYGILQMCCEIEQ